ncbi:MAG: hydantoinase B/oxoprolinase family protein [Alphaproteobacteria bacterium]|nr:hydantoinase B/oxoprolinase family protein [Alphaproteobacteria bacterium]
MDLDPITLTVLQNRFQQIAEEMDVILDRAAFSPIISEGRDRASGLYSASEGLLIAQGSSSMPIHIGTMQFGVATVARRTQSHMTAPHRPGDIYILNDPYLGGTHLMDVKLIMPVFVGAEVFCFLGSSGHWPDIGGSVPGGFVTRATEVQQEGLRIPGVKLIREGVMDPDLLAMILTNVRVPDQRLGDLQAQVGSLRAGEAELRKLIDEFGAPTLSAAIAQLRQQSARLVREKIASIPSGTYAFEDAMDNDGVDDELLWIRLHMRVERERIVFDFSRSSPPCRGPLNSVISATASSVYIAFKHIFPDIPFNAGCFAPLEIVAPETTFLNTGYPRPVSGCAAEVSQRIVDVVFGAMAQAIPGQVTAAPFGTSHNLALGGYDPKTDRRYIFYFYTGGGAGGWPGGDGISNACTTVGLATVPTLEILEQQIPILFEEYALRPDSCGPGEFRGGLGVRYRFRLLRGEGRVSVLGDRGKRGPFGVQGGGAAAPSVLSMTLQGRPYRLALLTKDEDITFVAGDTTSVETPGGGGYGDPRRRDPAAVAKDVANGLISQDYATRHHGAAARAAE